MGDLVGVVEFMLGLLAALALLVLVARQLSLPYPILLVVGGLALGFLPPEARSGSLSSAGTANNPSREMYPRQR